ncbi:uncharacterized protein LOC108667653 isoform X2 [Hyalella azteca]|uniref:Uncharacterized protein LOC108667653 isoform X2 n=1 Tax=Hyalella azteca TaxID=294128 RepID=A0A8B7N954_HYAAZ|nr:uncharacterized protein LOC108667653 isoform X2 [Hyalella azteca]
MPKRNPVETLENLSFELIFDVILSFGRNHDQPTRGYQDAELFQTVDAWVKCMPITILDRIIPKMLNHIASKVARRDRMKGLISILQLLLQPKLSKLHLENLFSMHRMSSMANTQIRQLLVTRVSQMHHLTEFHLPGKCTDAILDVVAASCPRLRVAKFGLSQVTDVGVEALVKGCPHLTVLELQDCTQVTSAGVLRVLERCKCLEQLHANNLLVILITNFHGSDRTFPFRHLSQYSRQRPDALPSVAVWCDAAAREPADLSP